MFVNILHIMSIYKSVIYMWEKTFIYEIINKHRLHRYIVMYWASQVAFVVKNTPFNAGVGCHALLQGELPMVTELPGKRQLFISLFLFIFLSLFLIQNPVGYGLKPISSSFGAHS